MQKINALSEDEITRMAEAFAYYDYGEEEDGMVCYYPGFPDRTRLMRYLKAIIRPALKSGAVYATSEKHEGIVIVTDTTRPPKTKYVLCMMLGLLRALGIKGFSSVMKRFQAGGESLERKYRNAKKDFVQVELLCIQKEFQGKGFMRQLLSQVYGIADAKKLPVIITTDAKLKKDKYVHLGMSEVCERKISGRSILYDMVREAKA